MSAEGNRMEDNPENASFRSRRLLALDIGTRKLIGLVVGEGDKGGEPAILAVAMEEHRERVMLDGQIHDIPKVAAAIVRIKEKLERAIGEKFTVAAVAAAGRALFTATARAARQIPVFHGLSPGEVREMELEAVAAAGEWLRQGEAKWGKFGSVEQYQCVGYSPVSYFLDGKPIGNPVGQRGEEAAVEVLATFLPGVVLDSLRRALELANLRVESLTLEPIAALEVVVPPGMRHLNLALVDVGAGTSDVAVTSGGTVRNFFMVPVAGDEITEHLAGRFLLDFAEAERVKRRLGEGGTVAFRDVLGMSHSLPAAQLSEELAEAVERLASSVAETIMGAENGTPQAVFCVGGGSLTPGLAAALARHLGLEPGRVAIKGRDTLRLFPEKRGVFQGPELVTPLGIARAAWRNLSLRFRQVEVNGNLVQVLELQGVTVLDALLAVGYSVRQLYGHGSGITLEVNGKVLSFQPAQGSAKLERNGEPAAMSDLLTEGDRIVYAKEEGETCLPLEDVLGEADRETVFYLNGQSLGVSARVALNGKPIGKKTMVKDRDVLTVGRPETVGEVLEAAEYGRADFQPVPFPYRYNGVERKLERPPLVVRRDGVVLSWEAGIAPGEALEVVENDLPLLREVLPEDAGIRVVVNGEAIFLPAREEVVTVNGEAAAEATRLKAGDEIVHLSRPREVIIAHLLGKMEGIVKGAGKGNLIISRNGEDIGFTTPLADGDILDIVWEKKDAS